MGLGKWKEINTKLYGFDIKNDPIKILGIWFTYNKQQLHDLNIGGKIAKMKKILNSWHARGLSLIGKITVLKALALSQLTYVFMNMDIPKETLNTIQQMIYKFIWGGKGKSKIKRSVLIQDYEYGGWKAPDIFTVYNSLKYGWIKRLMNTDTRDWRIDLDEWLDQYGGLEYVLMCNFEVGKMVHSKIIPFWGDVMKAYAEVHNKMERQELTMHEIKEQKLNNNRHIIIGTGMINYVYLIDKNIDTIDDWVNKYGLLWNLRIMKEKGFKGNWLDYMQIVQAIPKTWRNILVEKANTYEDIRYIQLKRMGLASKAEVKNELLQSKLELPSSIKYWNSIEGMGTSQQKWKGRFKLIRKMTEETKLLYFQYRILHNVLPTNERLYRQKQIDTKMCNECNEIEDIKHMLLTCSKQKDLWTKVKEMIQQIEGTEFVLNDAGILFGLSSKKDIIK
jgi:hypothetical protein